MVRLPRMRGDRPYAQQLRDEKAQFTPHARGSTSLDVSTQAFAGVYPACAGIDLEWPPGRACWPSLPRMRGDRPLVEFWVSRGQWFTPHARGST